MHTAPSLSQPEQTAVLQLLSTVQQWLAASPQPSQEALLRLQPALRLLAEQPDCTVAQVACRVELDVLHLLVAHQEATLRALDRHLQHAARWLAPDNVEQN